MVLFDNVCIGQRVEVLWNNRIYNGMVQYKGPIATKKGEWVGVALDLPVGYSSGLLFARSYFQCPPNHGVFLRSDKIRFPSSSSRCLFDRYHKVSSSSDVDRFLFETPYPELKISPCDPIFVSEKDVHGIRSSLGGYSSESIWQKPKQYHLRHLVSSHIPSATLLRAATAASAFRHLSRPRELEFLENDFEKKPSIPKIHMPHSALKKQVQRGWDGSHYVREMTVPTGRDKMKFAQWNDISP